MTEPNPVCCPICRRHEAAAFVRSLPDGYAWWHCEACDLRFSWPMRAGDSDYYRSLWLYKPTLQAQRPKRLRTIAQTWEYRAVLDHHPMERGRLLDIACGVGEFLHLAQQRYGYIVAGVDFNPDSVRTARETYGLQQVVCGSWPDAAGPIEPAAFDLVTMFHIIEHVADPIAALREAALALAPDGILAVAAPALGGRPELLPTARDFPPHHLTLWNERSLMRAFAAAGLEPISTERSPLLAEHLLIALVDKVPVLQQPTLLRNLFRFGRRLLVAPVALAGVLGETSGCVIVGFARAPRA